MASIHFLRRTFSHEYWLSWAMVWQCFLGRFSHAGRNDFAGTIMVLFSLLLLEWSITYTFDRSLGVVRLKRQRVLYTYTVERKLGTICSVQVSKQEDSDPPAHYVINLILASGETLQLRGMTENPQREEYDHIADSIRQFLGLLAEPSE